MSPTKKCPCCSGKLFADCCSPFINNEKFPQTALQLMRSRYSAYTLAHIDYIEKTMYGKAAEDFDPQNAKTWAQQVIWCGLTIVDPGKQQVEINEDEVEFAAKYSVNRELHILHERSQFQKNNGKWFYMSGTLIPHQATKINPSQPCPCGSRKKFASCCGKKS